MSRLPVEAQVAHDLTPDAVHVWRVSLDGARARIDGPLPTLTAGDEARAAAIGAVAARDRFRTLRAATRRILGAYLRVNPGDIAFDTNPFGKPFIAGPLADAGIRFNVSHADGEGLVAVACGREVGVDIEACVEDRPLAALADQFFSPAEARALEAVRRADRGRAFYATWTRKEAYLKARGTGLSLPLDSFTVSVAPEQPARLIETDPGDERARWTIRSLTVAAGFEAALVVEGTGWRLTSRGW